MPKQIERAVIQPTGLLKSPSNSSLLCIFYSVGLWKTSYCPRVVRLPNGAIPQALGKANQRWPKNHQLSCRMFQRCP
ncbi:hypothetical protein V5799_009948 [Amblyomma americanum]|uniref:Uncharacterized protein n=1 Tax=Amblyomma americanum TaxID=6943 RepID=A0AAQ4FA53_AMBAM